MLRKMDFLVCKQVGFGLNNGQCTNENPGDKVLAFGVWWTPKDSENKCAVGCAECSPADATIIPVEKETVQKKRRSKKPKYQCTKCID